MYNKNNNIKKEDNREIKSPVYFAFLL